MSLLGCFGGGNMCGGFDDIVDLIIVLIVLQFLCTCVLGQQNHRCC
ncbi:hypothetical protein [Dehalobacterium formicoaceticum]|uniref:Chorion class high-cysteine HCB protein 13 n=1 Tax=Dehalobacterium formicoaceticum TaxID=51515 RepID=A0ABT1Y1J7_9FIRM|nr:hypothetical protein [Dehalobacterium formicoaceticum]MCR6544742.1 hypothetical protein [Dehalobacterium formicoaceticum]